MAGLNKAQIIGNVTADPETRFLESGSSVTNLRVATNRSYKDREGNKQEETEFVPVVCFGKLSEIVQQFVTKGRQVYVEGRLHTDSWEDKETGQKRYRTEIVANDIQFLGSNVNAGKELVGAGADTMPF